VVGARRAEKGTMRWLRTPAKEFIRRLASFMTGSPIPDLNSGLRAFRRDVALRFVGILPNTHSWVSTITLAMLSNGYRVGYVPIDYYPRIGRSTFHPVRDTYNYLSLVFRTLTYFNPLKVFLPVSLVILAAGLIKLSYDLVVLRDIRESDVIMIVIGVLIAMLGIIADLVVTQNRYRYLAPPRLARPPEDGRERVQ
jgi:polyisoprenyl-phosphate glycosyltransferase